ncbi:MAG: ribosome hibernation-promoting factor, HPF/YfiA family [Hyphomicrobiales bacterium]
MKIQISGKNVDIGEALRSQIESRLVDDVAKYFDGTVTGHVTVAKDGGSFRADCTLHLSTGITLQSHGRSGEAYACFDQAAERLEKRLRRYKRRLKDHHAKRAEPVQEIEASSYVIAATGDGETEPHDPNPPVIAEDTAQVQELTVGEAVMKLDISDTAFLFFKNAGHGGLNLVYRREDGNIGWLDPGQ